MTFYVWHLHLLERKCVYFVVFYVFSQEGERVQLPSLEKEMVVAGGNQVYQLQQVEKFCV